MTKHNNRYSDTSTIGAARAWSDTKRLLVSQRDGAVGPGRAQFVWVLRGLSMMAAVGGAALVVTVAACDGSDAPKVGLPALLPSSGSATPTCGPANCPAGCCGSDDICYSKSR